MSTTTVPGSPASVSSRDRSTLRILVPYVIGIVSQLPMLLIYFSNLWARPHYQFFPVTLLMVAAFVYLRWPRSQSAPFVSSSLSNSLFWLALFFGLLGTVFAQGWFSAASVVLLLTSLFARTRDAEFPDRTLLVLSLPLFSIIMLPNYLDFRLIGWLQLISSRLSSAYLDLLGFRHFSPGTTLNFPGEAYEVERACSGVQSFFTLIFCATFIIVVLRRGFFRGLFLIISAVFWAILMNSVRIMLIPVAWEWFEWDLKSGLAHELLGYGVMLFACLMLLSTDQLIEYLFGSRQAEAMEGRRPFFSFRRMGGTARETVRTAPTSRTAFMLAAGAGVLVLFGIYQISDVVRSMNNPRHTVRFFDTNTIIDIDENALPEVIASQEGTTQYQWRRRGHNRLDRSRGSDLGQRSDAWEYINEKNNLIATFSLDQPFPGWHELTKCYEINGWEIDVARRRGSEKLRISDTEEIDWTYVEVGLRKVETSERGWLLFCFCDESGEPFEAPIEWDKLRHLFEGARNRLSSRIRSSLFRGQAYQMQVFVITTQPLPEELREEVRSQFFAARKHLRDALVRKSLGESGEPPAPLAPTSGTSEPGTGNHASAPSAIE